MAKEMAEEELEAMINAKEKITKSTKKEIKKEDW
jgi:hypothetical protein